MQVFKVIGFIGASFTYRFVRAVNEKAARVRAYKSSGLQFSQAYPYIGEIGDNAIYDNIAANGTEQERAQYRRNMLQA